MRERERERETETETERQSERKTTICHSFIGDFLYVP